MPMSEIAFWAPIVSALCGAGILGITVYRLIRRI